MRGVFQEVGHDGSADTIVMHEGLPMPELDENSVIIQVRACGLSLVDANLLIELFRKNPLSRQPVGHEISGVITQIGSQVTSLQCGDEVAGLLPLDSPYPGCAEFCVCSEYDVVKKMNSISFETAAGAVGNAIRAYSALHYQARLCSGDSVLVIDGASSFGNTVIQLAQQWGAKVLATASNGQERKYLEDTFPKLAQVVDIGEKRNVMLAAVLEETGGMGVDCVVDNGVKMFNNNDLEDENVRMEVMHPLPTKHDIISSLAMGGRWITSQSDLQLDPPDSQIMYMKSASVCFLFEHSWCLSSAQQGRYQHMLKDIMQKLEHNSLNPMINRVVTLDSAVETLKQLDSRRMEKVVARI
ncbi:quinone oxidoreductase-like protein 1 [Tubulanus polymorphus]|uniref:quinone oxidoreductase-like protein 1 n=1 Tax=Tubulanus polymorphus TaxID=672921 RepID=UPI003DA39168